MKTQTKVVLWVAGLAVAGFAAYKAYKYYKEEKELEEQALTIEDVKAYSEAKMISDDIKSREEKITSGVEEESSEDDVWYKNEDGVLERKLTREEFLYGADYDMQTEELVELNSTDGTFTTVVRKLEEPILLNYREQRSVEDVIESVEDMASQIRSLRNVEMEYEKRIYEANTVEAYDYYIALLMDRADITDEDLRKKLIVLSSYEYTPNVNDEKNRIVLDNLRANRFSHFGVSPYNTWGSIAEAILYYAHLLNFNVDDVSVEEYCENIMEHLGLEYDDRDVVINDIIVAYFEHNRTNRPNYDGTFGMFGLPELQYNSAKCLHDEYEFYLSNQTKLYGNAEDIV